MRPRRWQLKAEALPAARGHEDQRVAALEDAARGFFLVGARWDREKQFIWDSKHKEMHDTMPVVHFVPTQNFVRNKADYECPLYKTSARAGVLSTTGASTNFVVALSIPTREPPE